VRAFRIRTSVVKMQHFTISPQKLRLEYLFGYPICLFPTHIIRCKASFFKMTEPYPGYRILEEVHVKYKYIELCYLYAGATYVYILKMEICVLSNSIIKNSILLIFYISLATVIRYNIITGTAIRVEDAIFNMS
jgi:hypothetical protein